MHKWLAVTGMIAAFAFPPGDCARVAPLVDPCRADVLGLYVPTEGCPAFVPEVEPVDEKCADPREPCHYHHPAVNVDGRTRHEKVA